MNTQEAYDKIHEYFSRPGAVLARKPNGSGPGARMECFYRDKNGNKCAAGCLIPDELYDKPYTPPPGLQLRNPDAPMTVGAQCEGTSIYGVITVDDELKAIFNGPGKEGQTKFSFISEAQPLHDDHNISANVTEFLENLNTHAKDYDLEVKEPPK